MNKKEIPVLLLTGYLGSGKTTLVNHILANKRGIKFAVIVNDIGEVNIDADLIQRGGIVGKKDESLVALQNGCICCSLKMDLVEQIGDIMKMQRFDYIVIEASGICEPEPIAQTLCSIPTMGGIYTNYGICRLDCITTVVDALRLQSEFSCGADLARHSAEEPDIESLIIQQIEFCNIILLNKASLVQPDELARIKQILHALQPAAEIIECDYADVELDKLLDTHLFSFERVATSAGWIREIEKQVTQEQEYEAKHHHERHEHHHEHEHHHHEHGGHEHHHEECGHHHEHDGHEHHHHEHGPHCHCHHCQEGHSHTEEYGIETFVYYRRPAFDFGKFDHFCATKWPRNIIRAKGVCYFSNNPDMSLLFEQAGVQKQVTEAGLWYATATEEDLIELMRQEPGLLRDWDDRYGDRMIKLVFIGQHLDREQLTHDLDECLEG